MTDYNRCVGTGRLHSLLAGLCFLATAAFGAPSAKRGVCAQGLSAEDFQALAPGVSWYYNWFFEPETPSPPGGPEFVPMLWGDSPKLWSGLDRAVKTQPRPRAVFALNEPNLKSQANLTPQAAAHAWTRAKAVADRWGVQLVGPQLAIGTAAHDTLTAWDPVQKKDVAYTWMVQFWEAFRFYLPKSAAPVVAIHPYGNVGELKWAVGEMAKRSGRPVWVTEFNEWKAADEAAAIAYMTEAVAFMESSPDVAGYAWFMARVKDHPLHSLLANESGRLTRLGEAYVRLPPAMGK